MSDLTKNRVIVAIWEREPRASESLAHLSSAASIAAQVCSLCQDEPYAFGKEHISRFVEGLFAKRDSPSPDVDHVLILALDDEIIVAALMAQRIFSDIEIEYVVVSPRVRQQKLATILLETLEKEAISRNADRLILEVGVNNTPATRLYFGAGFTQIARRKNYYRGSEDALILEKNLTKRPAELAALAVRSPKS